MLFPRIVMLLAGGMVLFLIGCGLASHRAGQTRPEKANDLLTVEKARRYFYYLPVGYPVPMIERDLSLPPATNERATTDYHRISYIKDGTLILFSATTQTITNKTTGKPEDVDCYVGNLYINTWANYVLEHKAREENENAVSRNMKEQQPKWSIERSREYLLRLPIRYPVARIEKELGLPTPQVEIPENGWPFVYQLRYFLDDRVIFFCASTTLADEEKRFNPRTLYFAGISRVYTPSIYERIEKLHTNEINAFDDGTVFPNVPTEESPPEKEEHRCK